MLRFSLKTSYKFTIYTLVSVVFFIVHTSKAQTSIKNKNTHFLNFTNDSLHRSDSLRNIQDTIGNPDFYRLKDSTKKHYVIRQLYGLVLRKEELSTSGKYIREFESREKFLKYANKQIDEVRIVRLKSFGQSVYDTSIVPTTFVEKFGNSLRILTSKRVIEDNLLFKVGEMLKPVDLSETEQLLRELPYIEDANIIVETLTDTNKVRAIIVTKDKWTLAIGVRIENVNKESVVISESNFGGIGVGASASAYYDKSISDRWGYKGEIDVKNIAGSFFKSNFWFRQGLGYNSYYASLNRDFYASKAMFAGGALYFHSKEPYKIFSKDSSISINYNVLDWWIGRSFRVSRKNLTTAPYNLTLAFKYKKVDFDKSDSIALDYNPYFHSTYQYLFSAGLSNQNLYQSNLIYSFGSTEDIPIGFKVQLSSGIEQSQYQRRVLMSGEMSAAEITPLGYLYISFRTGGYMADDAKVEQAVVNIRSSYISNLFSVGRYDMRQFIRYDFTRGFSRFNGEKEYIALRSDYGVRGLRSNKLTGSTRLMVNLETVAYSPLYVYGFRFAYFLFCDLGLIGPSDDLVYSNPVYSGFGLGLRIKNESLIFPTLLVRFGYYPKLPSDAEAAYWLITTESRKRFEQFRMQEPYVVPFE